MPKGQKIIYPWVKIAQERKEEERLLKWDKEPLRVYLVGQQNLQTGWPWVAYKIGISDDTNKRLPHLQTGNPVPLEIIAVFHKYERPRKTERDLHCRFARFQAFNGGTEWFWDNPDIREFIRQLKDGIEGYKIDYLSLECFELEGIDLVSPHLTHNMIRY